MKAEKFSSPVVIYDSKSKVVYTAYWSPQRLKYEEKVADYYKTSGKVKNIPGLGINSFYTTISGGWPNNKLLYLPHIPENYLPANSDLPTQQEMVSWWNKINFRIHEKLYRPYSEGGQNIPKSYTEKGSIFLNVTNITPEFFKKTPENRSGQQTIIAGDEKAEDYLLYPCPRDDNTDIQEQRVGLSLLKDGSIFVSLKEGESGVTFLNFCISEDYCIMTKKLSN